MGHLNIEIKARCNNQAQVREYLMAHDAEFIGVDHQIDTYFNVTNGRLKLREGKIENFLIHYDRSNKTGPKESIVTLYEANPSSVLKELLIKALGILIIVDKKREIYFIDNVKFHIDNVKNLGTFVEIEAIDRSGDIGTVKLNKQCNKHIKDLGIKKTDLISVSYSDLLLS